MIPNDYNSEEDENFISGSDDSLDSQSVEFSKMNLEQTGFVQQEKVQKIEKIYNEMQSKTNSNSCSVYPTAFKYDLFENDYYKIIDYKKEDFENSKEKYLNRQNYPFIALDRIKEILNDYEKKKLRFVEKKVKFAGKIYIMQVDNVEKKREIKAVGEIDQIKQELKLLDTKNITVVDKSKYDWKEYVKTEHLDETLGKNGAKMINFAEKKNFLNKVNTKAKIKKK